VKKQITALAVGYRRRQLDVCSGPDFGNAAAIDLVGQTLPFFESSCPKSGYNGS
jgi:hypothetical protein